MNATLPYGINDSLTVSDKVKTVKDFTLRLFGLDAVQIERREDSVRSSAVNTVTVQSDPWDAIFGSFNDDPSWEDFPRWLAEQYRTDDLQD